MTDSNKNIPPYLNIANAIMKQIDSGEYKAGSRLPGAVRLAKMFNSSPVTANKALEYLEKNNVVQRNSRQGTFVQSRVKELKRILLPTSPHWYTESPQLISYLSGVIEEAAIQGIDIRLEPYSSENLETASSILDLDCQAILQIGEAGKTFPYNPLKKAGLPWVIVGVSDEMEFHTVSENRFKATYDLVMKMRADKLERIGMIANLRFKNHRACRDGYLEAMQDTGLNASLIRDSSPSTLEQSMLELINMEKIDALIIAGSMSVKCIAVLWRLGIKIPVGCFSESSISEMLRGETYYAELNHREAGKQAIDVLKRLVTGESIPKKQFI